MDADSTRGLTKRLIYPPPPPAPSDASEGKGPRRRPQRRLGRRLEGVAEAVGGGYCRLQIPLSLSLGVKETVAGHRLGALEGGGGYLPPPLPMHPCPPPPCPWPVPFLRWGGGVSYFQRGRGCPVAEADRGPRGCRARHCACSHCRFAETCGGAMCLCPSARAVHQGPRPPPPVPVTPVYPLHRPVG